MFMDVIACESDSRLGFGWDIGFIDNLQVITTNNCLQITITLSLISTKITTSHAKSFHSALSSPAVAW
jgi:hypothetical protein